MSDPDPWWPFSTLWKRSSRVIYAPDLKWSIWEERKGMWVVGHRNPTSRQWECRHQFPSGAEAIAAFARGGR